MDLVPTTLNLLSDLLNVYPMFPHFLQSSTSLKSQINNDTMDMDTSHQGDVVPSPNVFRVQWGYGARLCRDGHTSQSLPSGSGDADDGWMVWPS